MRKIFLFFIFSVFCCTAFSQSVGYITHEKEINTYATTDDFSNTFEINFVSDETKKNKTKNQKYIDTVKCQAVRLSKSWFITAAHCVETICKNGCDYQTRLIVGRNYEMDIISQSSAKHPQIFVHPERNLNNHLSTYDIALIYFKPSTSKYVYKDPQNLRGITQNEFINRLKNYKTYKRALNSYNTPTLLIIGEYRPQGPVLARKFSVLSSFEDERKVLKSRNNKAIYYPKTKTFILENFGIRQGISGSGLMTSKGELAGITSAISEIAMKNPLAQFAAFDKKTLKFIQEYIGEIEYTILK